MYTVLILCNHVLVPSQGQSGGLWLLWDSQLQVQVLEEDSNLIVAEILEPGALSTWILVAVYGDPARTDNPKIWDRIETYTDLEGKPVCLLGDFNSIVSCTEKWGGSEALSNPNRAFRAWVHGNGLLDLGHHGPAYTWSNKRSGVACIAERLDRALANIEWTTQNPKAAVYHLPRFNSDHLPILLRTKPQSAKKKQSFKCEDWWAYRDGFNEVCSKAAQIGGTDWSAVSKSFKSEVKKWGGGTITPDAMLRETETKMAELLSSDPATICLDEERRLQYEHSKCLQMQESYWAQRSRINWAISGDRNTKFFHATAISRNRRNTIRALQNPDGSWITEEKQILEAFLNHFKTIFQKGNRASIFNSYPDELLLSLPKIPDIFFNSLEALPTNLEIERALFSLGPLKAAGPDGFNAKIIQDNWSVFGPAILNEVSEFFATGRMKPGRSRSNLVLVPKSENANTVTQFRPISVCNIIYKIISKIISSRMKPFIASLISSSQCAFIPGREISENVILFKEILHSFKQRSYKNKEFCLKVDLSKAFDRMDWGYLNDILPLYGFPSRFVTWIMECVTSA